jgi:hypothetical protein
MPILATLSKDASSDVRECVARNPLTPIQTLMILADDPKIEVQLAVAQNSATPDLIRAQLLDRLSIHPNEKFRLEVAKNKKAVPHLLETLSSDPHEWVRKYVAKNPSTPPHTLEVLSRDSDYSVRENVAKNHSTPTSIIEKLGKESNSDVQIAVIGNPKTSDAVLIKLLSAKTARVREALALQAHRSPEIRIKLWRDGNDAVRRAVATCADLDQQALDELVQDTEMESDLVALFGHPNLSATSIQFIAERLLNTPATAGTWYQRELANAKDDVSAAAKANNILGYHGKDPNKAVLSTRAIAPVMALCSGTFIEPARLVRVVESTDWLVRAAVARNPSTPSNLIKKLSADAHPLVSALAKKAQAISEAHPIKSQSAKTKGIRK